MKILVRQASLDSERHTIIEFLRRYLTPRSDEARFDWLYLNNPHGRAYVWVATQPDQSMPLGMAAAFPRRVLIQGRQIAGWVLGDFCISDEHRSLGPALQLQRACINGVDSGSAAFCYDFPSAGMMAVYRRLRIPETSALVRFAKPLRVDRKVTEFVKAPFLSRAISAAGNFVLRMSDGVSSPSREFEYALQQQHCGDEFTTLAQRVAGQWGMHIEHSAAYVNWRFLSNPLSRHEMLVARDRERVVGYVVFAGDREDATVIEMFGETDRAVVRGLVTALLKLLRERNIMTVSAPLSSSHPWAEMLQQHGFRRRESVPIVIYRAPQFGCQFNGADEAAWWFASGDRDS